MTRPSRRAPRPSSPRRWCPSTEHSRPAKRGSSSRRSTSTLAGDQPRRFAASIPSGSTVRSGGCVVASLNSAEIYLVRIPEAPMLFSWWARRSRRPAAFDAAGRLTQPAIEAALRSDGSLGAPARGAGRARAGRCDPDRRVVQPSLLRDAQRMANGYTRSDGTRVAAGTGGAAAADAFLEGARHGGRGPARPAGRPALPGASLPALLASGLAGRRPTGSSCEGRPDPRSRSSAWTPVPGVSRPPSAACWTTRPSRGSPSGGSRPVLADADDGRTARPARPASRRPRPRGPHAERHRPRSSCPTPGPTPFCSATDLLADPVRAAQAVLGELAVDLEGGTGPLAAHPARHRRRASARSLPPQLWGPLSRGSATRPS